MTYKKEVFDHYIDKQMKYPSQKTCTLVLSLSGTVLSKLDEARKIEGNKLSRVEFITSLLEYYFQ